MFSYWAMIIAFAGTIHAVIGWVVVQVFTVRDSKFGMLGGIFPDFDGVFLVLSAVGIELGFPFVHRGITHTPFFLILTAGTIWWLVGFHIAYPVAIGWYLHLLVDSFSNWTGIMWLYPLDATKYATSITDANKFTNMLSILLVGVAILWWFNPKHIRYNEH